MFLCSNCHDEGCFHFTGSRGPCEGCGKTADCVDCTKYKKKRSRRKKQITTDKNGNPIKKRTLH